MNKHSKCGCSYKEDKCKCKKKSKTSGKNKLYQEAKLGSSSNPIHFAFPTQNNDYDVKLNTIFGKNPYRNVLGNYGDLKPQGIGVFFNQGMPSNGKNILDLQNSNGVNSNMTEDNLGFNSNADLDTMIYDDWIHSIPDQTQQANSAQDEINKLFSGDWDDIKTNSAQDEINKLFSGDWDDNQNKSNDLINSIITSPNTTLSHIQDSEVSPLDNFFQPTQDNNLVSPINLFQTPSKDDLDDDVMSPYLQESAETGRIPDEYIDDDEVIPLPDDHRWLFYGIMPNFSALDGVDPDTFTQNREDYAYYINEVRDARADELRGLIKMKADGIRGETKSKFERRNKKSLKELYAKVSLFKDYNNRGMEL